MLLTKLSSLLTFTLLASTLAAYLQKRDQTVTFSGRSFINHGLVGFGRFSASAIDSYGETLGGLGSSIGLTSFQKNSDGTFSGGIRLNPDRGHNTQGTTDYRARSQEFTISFNPNTGGPTRENVALKYQSSVLYTNGLPPNYTTGLDPKAVRPATLLNPALPIAPSDNHLSIDQEGFALSKDGLIAYISDEYGPYIYVTQRQTGVILATIAPPAAITPMRGGKLNFTSETTPDSGRNGNQGFEGPCMRFTLAKTLLVPILDYGLYAMLPIPAQRKDSAAKQLEEVDAKIIRYIAGLKKSKRPNYTSLCVELGWLPVSERLWVQARKAGVSRFGHLLTTKTVVPPTTWRTHAWGPISAREECVVAQFKPILAAPWLRKIPFDRIEIAASKDDAFEAHKEEVEDFEGICVYTDGSKKDNKSGYGYVLKRGDVVVTGSFPTIRLEYGGVFHSECNAIGGALERVITESDLLMNEHSVPYLKIFTDSQSSAFALRRYVKWRRNSPLDRAHDAAAHIKRISPSTKIEIVWIPGHRGIEGNELADQAANRGCDMAESLPDNVFPIMEEALETAWTRARKGYKRGTTATAVGAPYDQHRGKEFRSMQLGLTSAQIISRLQWLGGYAFSRAYPLTQCPACHSDLEIKSSPEAHILFDCEATKPRRRQLGLLMGPDDQGGWILSREHLDKFLAELQVHLTAGRGVSASLCEKAVAARLAAVPLPANNISTNSAPDAMDEDSSNPAAAETDMPQNASADEEFEEDVIDEGDLSDGSDAEDAGMEELLAEQAAITRAAIGAMADDDDDEGEEGDEEMEDDALLVI